MAEDSSGTSQPSPPAARSGPVLVPQANLLGKPDISLSRSVMTAGSRESCRIHLVSRSISQYHALFVNSSGTVAVCDLASRTGVLVNAKPVKYADLKNGDLVQLGKFVFRFRAPRPEAVAGPPDPAVLDIAGDLPVSLEAKMMIIGRRESCDLPLTDDADVSTLHAVLFQHDGNWIIRDLDSRTGTRVNGIRTHQAKLKFGDSIKIGKTTFAFSPATDVLQTPTADDAVFPESIAEPTEPQPASVAESPDVAEMPAATAGDGLSLDPPPFEFPEADSAATESVEITPAEPSGLDLESLPTQVTALGAIGESPTGSVESSEVESGPLQLEPIESSVTINTERPIEPDDFEAEPVAESVTPDRVPREDENSPADDALDLGSASTFDLPLELDLAEAPRLGGNDGAADETIPAKAAAGPSTFDDDLPAPALEPPEPAEALGAAAEPAEIFDGSIEVADDVSEPVSLDALDAPTDTVTAARAETPPPPSPSPSPSADSYDFADEAAEKVAPSANPEVADTHAVVQVDEAVDVSHTSTSVLPANFVDELMASDSAIDELPLPVLTEAAASPPPLVKPIFEAEAKDEPLELADDSAETETVDFGEPRPPEPPPEPAKPVRKRVAKIAAPKPKPVPNPRGKGRRKSVTPVLMDVVETMATDPLPVLPVVAGGALLPEVAAAMELADGLPAVESIETSAMLDITTARPDEPTLTMTESMPAVAYEDASAVTVSDTAAAEPVDTRDMARPADDDIVITTSNGLITEQLLVETDTDIAPAEPEPSTTDAATVHEPSELLDEPASLHTADNDSFAELAALSENEEFVAIPEPEPEPEPTEIDVTEANAWPAEDTLLDLPADGPAGSEMSTGDAALVESGAEGQSLDVDTDDIVSVDQAADGTSLDSASVAPTEGDAAESTEGASDTTEPVDEPTLLAPSALAPSAESMMLGDLLDPGDVAGGSGPPMFGFDFGAGSFLGGMPLEMQPPPPTFGKAGYAFDEKPPAAPQAAAPAPPPPPPQQQHAEYSQSSQSPRPPMATAPAALVDLDVSSLLSFDEPSVPMSAERSAVVNVEQQPLTAFDEAIQLPASARSSDDQTITSTTSRPAINTLADEVAIPPLVSRSADEQAPVRKTLTTAFDGLAGGLGAAAGNVDVFSQMAQPIHDELFGSRGDDPADVVLPNTQPEIPPSAPRRDPPLQIPPIDRAGAGKSAAASTGDADYADEDDRRPRRDRYAGDAAPRFARLPTLALLMLLCLIAAGMMIYFFLPPPVDVVGTLTFTNLGKQTVAAQRQFAVNQVQRLESGDVRNIARSIAAQKAVGNGFLDDDMEYARVTANADWDGDVMTLHQTTTDEYAARTRMSALLEALAHQDADLNDALGTARAAATAAHDAVAAQQQVISRIRADRETQVRIGDSAPRMEDVAALERKANQLDAAWVSAKTLRSDAQLVLDKLRQMDPATPTDPHDDPLLAELRSHQQDADVRLAVARATAAKPPANGPPPDADLSSLVSDVDQTRAAIAHRLGILKAEVKQTPEQRIVSRQAAIEAQSVKLATLQAAEADAATAAQTAAVAARDQRTALDAGRMASIQVEDLIHRQEAADQVLKEDSDDQAAKDEAVNLCVQVAAAPKVDTKPGRDIRPVAYGLAGGAIVLLFATLAAVSTRPMPAAPVMPTAAAVPAAPIPVFGANRKPRPDARRPKDAPSPQPDPASRT